MPKHFPTGVDLYFPNVVFRMIRSRLPPHEVAFRVPTHFNKVDIKGYLSALYDVTVTRVATSIIPGKMTQNQRGVRQMSSDWKKAIVSLDGDFQWPTPPSATTTGVITMPEEGSKPFGRRRKTAAELKEKEEKKLNK